jgi:hypothetical protein
MDGVDVGDLGRTDYRRNVEVTFLQAGRPDADGFIGKADVKRIAVSLTVDGDRLDAEFLAGANDTQGDLPAVRN